MSYQVFARKYRPQTFDDLVGQEHVTRTLKNAIEQNRLAHAYLFVGPRGTGKTSTARILAKALNCVNGPTITPCGVCDSCKEIAAGNASTCSKSTARATTASSRCASCATTCSYAPAKGQFKIYIIDEVHMLTTAAFNALLKTLEEPPAHVKFIFATTEPQKVLPTISRRCQRFDLRRIPANLIAKHLAIHRGQGKDHARSGRGARHRARRGWRSARRGIDARSTRRVLRRKDRGAGCAERLRIYERTDGRGFHATRSCAARRRKRSRCSTPQAEAART